MQRAKVAYRGDSVSIEQLDRVLRHDTPSIGLWLDNSDQQPNETVGEIIERGLDVGSID